MKLVQVRTNITLGVTEVRDELDYLIGAVSPVAVPGLAPISPLAPVMHFVGWSHDWNADNPHGEYLPLCIGVSDEWNTLISEIEKRARDAQS